MLNLEVTEEEARAIAWGCLFLAGVLEQHLGAMPLPEGVMVAPIQSAQMKVEMALTLAGVQ